MKSGPIRSILRGAVLAALPITQVSCMTPATNPNPPVTEKPDACRLPETREAVAPTEQGFTVPVKKFPLSNEACVAECRKTVNIMYSDSLNAYTGFKRIDNFQVSQCGTKYESTDPNYKSFACTASYTIVNAGYTGAKGCPAPPLPPQPVVGRMPAGLHVEAAVNHNAIGRYFAEMTMMESAAVTAFRYLARELEAYQAPAALIERAKQAAKEEIEHAKMAGKLSKAFDAKVPGITVDDFQLRSLGEIALENAVEGCVNETFAAACGLWQHQRAELKAFRDVIGAIAEDESGHAELSWAIHQWIMPQLNAAERAHIQAAQEQAIADLEFGFSHDEHPAVQRAVGLPTPAEAGVLLQQLRADLWAPRLVA